MSRTNRMPLAAGAAALTLVLTACGNVGQSSAPEAEDGATGTADAASDCPVEVNEEVDTAVRIAYQPIPNGDLVVRDQGWLEACMPNADISWSQFASGGEVIQAFGSGSVDLGLVGSSPMVKAVSAPNNMELQVIWIHDVIGEAESLVVQEGAGEALPDLAGKRIAVPFASTAHYSLLAALEREGMTAQDVELMNMSPDAMLAAWERQEVDAAWVWAPTLPRLTESGSIILSAADTAEAGAPTFDLAAATTEFIEANTEFMQTWTAVQDQAVKLIKEDPAAAAESIAVELGNTPDEVSSQLEGYTFLEAAEQSEQYFSGTMAEALAKTADFLVTQQEIDEAGGQEVYAEAVYSDAISQVAQ